LHIAEIREGKVDEIRLWKIEGSRESPTVASISGVKRTKTEEMLEDILVKSPNLLIEGLKLIGRQTDTPVGTPDLIGVDEDGELIVFELKRGVLTRDAVAQVIDYASYLAELTLVDLSTLVTESSGKYGIEKIEDFPAWYELQFGKPASVGKPKMMLVGLGVDDRARRMVEFLADGDVEVSLITFHGFSDGDSTFLAKQVEVAQKEKSHTRVTKAINLQKLLRRVQAAGVEHFFNDIATALRAELNPYEWPNQGGYTYYLQDVTEDGVPSNRGYVSLYVPDNSHGVIVLAFLDRAIAAAGDDWMKIATSWGARVAKKKGSAEIKVVSADDWKTIEFDVKKLCGAIMRGRKLIREQQIVTEQREQLNDIEDGQAA
jgi:hypothetical protein